MTNDPKTQPEQWLEAHGDVLFRYALARVRQPAEAEDLVQETFLAAMKSKERFSGRSTERTWLVGILKHKIIDHIRKSSREQTYEDPDIPAAGLDAASEHYFDRKGHWRVAPPDWQIHPRKSFERREFNDVLHQCLGKLKERFRMAFVLRELEGEDAEAICKQLNITSTNLWVILYRARMQLKACLETNWLEKEEPAEDA